MKRLKVHRIILVIGETTNVAGQRSDVVRLLMLFVDRARDDLGDSPIKLEGKNVRPAGH